MLRTHLTLISSIAGIAVSFSFLAFALAIDNATRHFEHPTNKENFGIFQLSRVEHSPNLIREGDAKIISDFMVNSQFVEPDNNCSFCTQVNYTPARERQAGISYNVGKIDLTGSKRIVFFAMGQEGGEQIYVVAAGKNKAENSNNTNKFGRDLFPQIEFELITQNISLSKDWKRYEISLNGTDLRDITIPFGFVIFAGKSEANQVFYLKGVTFDSKSPRNSNLIFSNLNNG